MEERSVDVLVIGAGSAGLNAVSALKSAGVDWLLVEADRYGTTCARVGCMPSKLLIAAANVAHTVHDARTFGIQVGDVAIDGEAVFQRVRKERDRFVKGVVEDTESLPEQRRLMGTARFENANTVIVGEQQRITAKAIIIAVGGAPSIPPVFDPVRDRVLTSDTIFELKELPGKLAVIGTGVIGLELGQALHHLGVSVSLFSHGTNVGPLTDPKLQEYVRTTFADEMDVQLEANIVNSALEDDNVRIKWRDRNGNNQSDVFDTVLVATGRKSNLATLNFEATGLGLGDDGTPEWDSRTTQCGELPIFLAGDANYHRAVLHEASDEGRIAGQNAAAYPNVTAHVRRTPLTIVFTEPQMAIAGLNYAALDQDSAEIAEFSYENQGRARVINRATGLVRLYADRRSCTLIGAEMFGPQIEHLAHLLAWSIEQRLSVQRLLQMPFYHPVLEEGLRTGLRKLAKQLQVDGDCRAEDRAESSGM